MNFNLFKISVNQPNQHYLRAYYAEYYPQNDAFAGFFIMGLGFDV
jgi:hypothetical protein